MSSDVDSPEVKKKLDFASAVGKKNGNSRSPPPTSGTNVEASQNRCRILSDKIDEEANSSDCSSSESKTNSTDKDNATTKNLKLSNCKEVSKVKICSKETEEISANKNKLPKENKVTNDKISNGNEESILDSKEISNEKNENDETKISPQPATKSDLKKPFNDVQHVKNVFVKPGPLVNMNKVGSVYGTN